jgi:tetratricopeptide (TPR) repeat protein
VAEVWLFLGIARYAHGEVQEAAEALRASLCLDPALWPASFYLARAYERLGRRADALQQYDSVAVDDLKPFALQSSSAVINELRAFQHDFRAAAKRLSSDRSASSRSSKSTK